MVIRLAYTIDSDNSRRFRKFIMNRLMGRPMYENVCVFLPITETSLNETRVVGEIVNMSADESVLTNGKVDLAKLQPVIYDSSSNAYRVVGDSVGQAWQSGEVLNK